MNAVTDIADLEAEPLDEGIGRAEARLRGVARAGEVGLVLLEVVEALALKAARRLKAQAEDEALDPVAIAAARDLAQAYGKISRSIRQNALLEERLEAGVEGRTRARAGCGARRALDGEDRPGRGGPGGRGGGRRPGWRPAAPGGTARRPSTK